MKSLLFFLLLIISFNSHTFTVLFDQSQFSGEDPFINTSEHETIVNDSDEIVINKIFQDFVYSLQNENYLKLLDYLSPSADLTTYNIFSGIDDYIFCPSIKDINVTLSGNKAAEECFPY